MYETFYNLPNNPFRLTPDPDFCFRHSGYKRAHEYLDYALKLGEGVVMVTGGPGTGKTTLIESFMSLLDMSSVKLARIPASNLESDDLLRAVAYGYGIDAEGLDKATLRHRIRCFLEEQVKAGWRVLLIIDEAQSLPNRALEELRLLADLQVDSRQLLQLFVVGQELLREHMADGAMNHFQQRVIAHYHLMPLSLAETRAYVEYRLLQAGWQGDPEFTGAAIRDIYNYSRGIPRHINKLCNRLLLLGYGKGSHILDSEDVQAITCEMSDEQLWPVGDDHTQVSDFVHAAEATGQTDAVQLSELAVKRDKSVAVASRVADVVQLPTGRPDTRASIAVTPLPDARPDMKIVPAAAASSQVESMTLHPIAGRLVAAAAGWRTRLTTVTGSWHSPVLSVATFTSVAIITAAVMNQLDIGSLFAKPVTMSRQVVDMSAPVRAELPRAATPFITASSDMYLDPGLTVISDITTAAPGAGLLQMLNSGLPAPAAGALLASAVAAVTAEQWVRPDMSGQLLKAGPARLAGLNEYLYQGNRALQEYRLLTPARDSAYYYFQSVLRVQPNNPRARAGIDRIVERYVKLAQIALDQHDEIKAHRYISRGLSLRPDNSELKLLRDQSGAPESRVVLIEDDSGEVQYVREPDGIYTRIKSFFTSSMNAQHSQVGSSYQVTSSFVRE